MSGHLINDKFPWIFRLAFAYHKLSESLSYSTPQAAAFLPVVIDKLGYDVTMGLKDGERPDMTFVLNTGMAAIVRNHHALNCIMYNDLRIRTNADKKSISDITPDLLAETMTVFKEAKMRYWVEDDKDVRFDLHGIRLIADKVRKLLYTGVKMDSRQLYTALIYTPSQLAASAASAMRLPVHRQYAHLVSLVTEARLFLELGLYLYMLGMGIDIDDIVAHYMGVDSTYAHNVTFPPTVSSMTIAAALLPMYESTIFMERHARIFNRQKISIPEATQVGNEAMRYVNIFYGHTE